MIGEFGFLLASGNTNTSDITTKMDTSHELTTWSYQITVDAIYKQNQQEIDGEKRSQASAQKIFLSGQFDYKLTTPDDRLFIYVEYENNQFSGFSYQMAFAAGWTSIIWHDKHSELTYRVGPGCGISEIEHGNNDKDNKGFIVRVAM